MRFRRPLLAALVACLLLTGCAGGDVVLDLRLEAATSGPVPEPMLERATWPETARWITDQADQHGRPVIVKFFASWCLPCRAEAPVLLAAARNHPDVMMLGVDHEDRLDAAQEWIREFGFDAIPTLFDPAGETARAMGARGMPAVSFVSGDGLLLHTHTGPMDEQLLEEWVRHLLGQGPRPADRVATSEGEAS